MRRKKNFNRKNLMFILAGVIGVFGITIVYAALFATLKIDGTAELQGNTWGITLEVSNRTNNASTLVPTVDGDRVRFLKIYFNTPGDYAEYEINVINNGTLIGELKDIIVGTPVCTSDTGNADDERLICDNIELSFKYADGNPVEVGDILYNFIVDGESLGYSAICKQNDLEESMSLFTRSNREIIATITYNKDVDRVPSSKVTVTGLDVQFLFEQTNNDCKYERGSLFD